MSDYHEGIQKLAKVLRRQRFTSADLALIRQSLGSEAPGQDKALDRLRNKVDEFIATHDAIDCLILTLEE